MITKAELIARKDTLDDAAMAVMRLNGGSAVPLWNTWLDGMQEGAPESEEMGVTELKAMFARAFEELDDMSGAKVGDKTLMDTLIPATEAMQRADKGHGVLLLTLKYAGDQLAGKQAMKMAAKAGMNVRQVITGEEIQYDPNGEDNQRGLAACGCRCHVSCCSRGSRRW